MSKQKKNETKVVEEVIEHVDSGVKSDIPEIQLDEPEIQNEDALVIETFKDIKSKAEEESETVTSIVRDNMHVDATVIPSKLNMRKNPSMMGRIIAVLSRGEHVTIDFTVPEVNGFVSVRYKALTGYIMKQYLNY